MQVSYIWVQYLREFLSSLARKESKYKTRRIERLDEFLVTYAQADKLEHHYDIAQTYLNRKETFLGILAFQN